MSIPGMPAWAEPDKPVQAPKVGIIDPPLIQGQPDGSAVVYPMVWAPGWGQGYAPPGGGAWDDSTQINQALQQYPIVYLAGGPFNIAAGINNGALWYASLIGVPWATVLNYSGDGAAVTWSNPNNPQGQPVGFDQKSVPEIHHIVIDGTNAGAGAVGLLISEMNGGVDLKGVLARNFTAGGVLGGSAGIEFANSTYSTNEVSGRATTSNCTYGFQFTAPGSENAIEAIDAQLTALCQAAQTAFHMNGALLYRSTCKWFANMQPNSNYVIEFEAGSAFTQCDFQLRAEQPKGAGTASSLQFNSATGTFLHFCTGTMAFPSTLVDSNISSQEFQLDGGVNVDAALTGAQLAGAYQGYGNAVIANPGPQPVASGTAVNNNQNMSCLVIITGGAVTGITTLDANGNAHPYTWPANSPFVPVPDGGTITLTYTAAPALRWVPYGG